MRAKNCSMSSHVRMYLFVSGARKVRGTKGENN